MTARATANAEFVTSFVASRDDEDDAWSAAFRLGAVLRRHAITERYGIRVRRLPLCRVGGPAWGLYLVDRTPAEPVPTHLIYISGAWSTRALVVELLALAA
ncbi:hypothetical protein [Kitasatospora sp. NPDC001095]